MRAQTGTSGFAYKEWKGSFYPADIKPPAMLSYYAQRFNSVEINNTFYRMPAKDVMHSWRDQVGPDFRFVLKASQRITHRKRLKDAADDVSYFLATAAELGDRLGPTLFQLPPNLKLDLPRLRDFLALIPSTHRAAFEFRHPSWFDDAVYDALREHGVALCVADTDETEEGMPTSSALPSTASWGYVRLRREEYDADALRAWATRIARQPWETAYVFLKHEDAGVGPKYAAQIGEMLAGLS